MQGNLQSWSWGDIQAIYAILGRQLQEYDNVNKRIGIPKPHIELSDESNIFILRFWRDVKRLNEQVKCLDREIKRRNNLIGVIG
mgnify:FL=1